ncbi:MAG: peptidoglycan DD-metalloendopeptidase family protein [Bdellovibrionota bacterium]
MNFKLLLVCFLLLPVSIYADTADRLEVIKREVDSYSEKYDGLISEQAKIKLTLKNLSTSISKIKEEEKSIDQAISNAAEREDVLSLEQKRKESESKKLIELSLKRIRASYMQRSGTLLEQVVSNEENNDFFRTAFYLSKVRAKDLELLDAISIIQLELARQAKAIANVRLEKEGLKEQKIQTRKKLEAEQADRDTALAALKKETANVEEVLAKLRAQALRLEAVVASLTGAEDDEPPPAKTKESVRVSRLSKALDQTYEGIGLDLFKGKLPSPVGGKVIRRFGKHQAQGFKDIVFNKGIEFATEAEANIRAVAVGKVIFLGRMPGYGTVIILDHGKRMYSLYARVADVRVEKGDLVGQGSKLAIVEEVGGDTGLFYFEIRDRGKAVDPQKYLMR